MNNFTFLISQDQSQNIERGYVLLEKTPDNFDVWRKIAIGDRIFVAILQSRFSLYCILATGVGITTNLDATISDKGYIIYFSRYSYCRTIQTSLSIIQSLAHPDELSASTADKLYGICSDSKKIVSSRHDGDIFPTLLPNECEIDIAIDQESMDFIRQCLSAHPFGDVYDGWPLVIRKRQELIGGAMIRLGAHSSQYHRTERRIFGNALDYIRDESVHISRIVSKYKMLQKHYTFYMLIMGISLVSRHLFKKPTTFLSGVSYDLIPAAYRAGSRIELPDFVNGAIYYWKSFVPESDRLSQQEYDEIKRRYRGILTERRRSEAWIVFAQSNILDKAITNKLWLISNRGTQKAKWHAIRPGDTVFMATSDGKLVAETAVKKKYKRIIGGFEKYPLNIELSDITKLNWSNTAKLRPIINWLLQFRDGGITSIAPDVSLWIRNFLDEGTARYRMWLTPNPALLQGTDFTVTKKQVFLVQAWDLRESILPCIRAVCESHGYVVVHADDRQGQVIFEPIWRMLNESEAILIDFTGKRPNVYLEFGMALVLGKPIVAITQNEDDVPSDTPNLKWHQYRGVAAMYDLEKILPKAIAGTIEHLDQMRRAMSPDGQRR